MLVVVAGVLVAVLSGGNNAAGAQVQIHGSGLTEGRTTTLPAAPASISIGTRNLWASLPGRNEIVRSSLSSAAQETFPAAGNPSAIVAGVSAVWVAEPGTQTLAQFNGDLSPNHSTKLPGTPGAIALDQQDSSPWVADSSGAISHVALWGAVIGTPGRSAPAASSLAFGDGAAWGTNGTSKGLVQVAAGTSGMSTAFFAGSSPIAVTVDQGVWSANANGQLTRFNPQPGQLRLNADLMVAPELDAVAATDPGPYVWALSKQTKTLYRVTAMGTPAVTGTVVFASTPVALAVNAPRCGSHADQQASSRLLILIGHGRGSGLERGSDGCHDASSGAGECSNCVIRRSSSTRASISPAVSRSTRSVPNSSTLYDASAVPYAIAWRTHRLGERLVEIAGEVADEPAGERVAGARSGRRRSRAGTRAARRTGLR